MFNVYKARDELINTIIKLKELYVRCGDKCTKELICEARVVLGNDEAMSNYELGLDGEEYAMTKRKTAEVLKREFTSRYDSLLSGFDHKPTDIKKLLKDSYGTIVKIDVKKYDKLLELFGDMDLRQPDESLHRILDLKTDKGYRHISPVVVYKVRGAMRALDTDNLRKWVRYIKLMLGDVLTEALASIPNGGELGVLTPKTIGDLNGDDSQVIDRYNGTLTDMISLAGGAYEKLTEGKAVIDVALEDLDFRYDLIKTVFKKLKDLDAQYDEGVITLELYNALTNEYYKVLRNYNTITCNAINGVSMYSNRIVIVSDWLANLDEIFTLLKKYFTPLGK